MQQCSQGSQCKESLQFSSVQISVVPCFAHLFFPVPLDGSVRGSKRLALEAGLGRELEARKL